YYTTPLGNAVMRTWVVNGTSVRMRVVLLPICNSSASVMFSNVWVEPSGLQMADWWLGGLRPLASGKPPACATLDPKGATRKLSRTARRDRRLAGGAPSVLSLMRAGDLSRYSTQSISVSGMVR